MDPETQRAPQPEAKLWSKHFVLVILIQTLDDLVFFTTMPVMALYVLDLGGDIFLSGIVISVFPIASIISRPFSGYIADRFGRKGTILITIVVNAFMQMGYAFIKFIPLIVGLRIVNGFFYAVFSTVISAMALQTLPESRQSEGMGWFGLGYVFATIFGPALGVMLSENFGYSSMFIMTAMVAFATLLLALFLPKAPTPSRAKTSFTFPHLKDLISVKCLPLAAVSCCFMTTWGILGNYIVMVGDTRGVDGVSLFFMFNSLSLLFSRPLIGKLVDRFSLSKLMVPCVAFETLTFVCLSLAHSLWLFLASGVIKALGSGGILPSIQAACGQVESPERSGVAMSTYLLSFDVGNALGPIIAGSLSPVIGLTNIFIVALPITLLSLPIYFGWRHYEIKKSR